ncbi:MAG: O-antigen ligase family protein [Paracoccus sp. (in: a-proteobacteria)]|uniref:O-antigen ligase family protein n=2 Tax=Paracoccus sp. TaxID=267 RepID=UPI002E8B079F|nr:O-antigen ligase family protein [Pseudomonadota bacterium]
MLTGLPVHADMRRQRPARRGLQLTWSPDVLAATVAIGALALVPLLESLSALAFLAAGMWLIVTGPDRMLRVIRQEWLVVLMAVWCLSSFTWSDYPALTIRYGLQLFLTILIVIAICDRIPVRILTKIVLATHLVAGVLSLASGRAREVGGFLGIYGSKNALSAAMGLLFLVSFAVLLDRRMSWLWRGLGVVGSILGLMLLVMGQSTGALAAVVAAVLAVGPILLLQRLNAPTRVIVVVLSVVLTASVVVMLSTMIDTLALMFLDATGKDVTLTGRTDLWRIAFGEIVNRPFLGAGFQAVWVHGNPLAEDLWQEFGIKGRSGFHFHNTLISNAVEIGLIGAILQASIFFMGLWYSLKWTIGSHSGPSLFLALFMVRQLMSMGVEVVFFFQFDILTLLTIAALYYGRNFSLSQRA